MKKISLQSTSVHKVLCCGFIDKDYELSKITLSLKIAMVVGNRKLQPLGLKTSGLALIASLLFTLLPITARSRRLDLFDPQNYLDPTTSTASQSPSHSRDLLASNFTNIDPTSHNYLFKVKTMLLMTAMM